MIRLPIRLLSLGTLCVLATRRDLSASSQSIPVADAQQKQPPVLRMLWGRDGSMFAGGSSRGWGGGKTSYELARLVWTGAVPFEIHEMRAKPNGFELTFTQPVDAKTAADVNSYKLRSWTYNYYDRYSDDHQDEAEVKIKSANVAGDGRSVMLEVEPLRAYYVHALSAEGVRSTESLPLLHRQAYYTLNRIPK